jgi:hypothetical protein
MMSFRRLAAKCFNLFHDTCLAVASREIDNEVARRDAGVEGRLCRWFTPDEEFAGFPYQLCFAPFRMDSLRKGPIDSWSLVLRLTKQLLKLTSPKWRRRPDWRIEQNSIF